ncbi:MAG TPA: hypothetical protein VEI81_05730, partial [Methanoregula sp.]|nr:hypothetical protein [Methanoregula sp.]
GVIALSAIVSAAVVSAFIVLFIDLSLPAFIALSLVALASAALATLAIRERYYRKAWLPRGSPGKKWHQFRLPMAQRNIPPTMNLPE